MVGLAKRTKVYILPLSGKNRQQLYSKIRNLCVKMPG